MNNNSIFSSLNPAERWLLIGNILTACGFMAISIGSALRLASEGGLPTGRPIFDPRPSAPEWSSYGQPFDSHFDI